MVAVVVWAMLCVGSPPANVQAQNVQTTVPLDQFGSGFYEHFGFNRGGVNGSIGFRLAQGSSRSISSSAATVTSLDGVPGSISAGVVRPFVTGVTPVVGGAVYGQPVRDNVSNQMFHSHQQTQAARLSERFRANQQSKQRQAEEAFRRGIEAEETGKLRMARANYRRALSSDQGPLRRQILMRMHARGWK